MYARADVTVLDDVLSALDPGLGTRVFKQVMAGGGLLRGPGRTVLVVTQNPAILSQCDQIIFIKDSGVEYGSHQHMISKGLISVSQHHLNLTPGPATQAAVHDTTTTTGNKLQSTPVPVLNNGMEHPRVALKRMQGHIYTDPAFDVMYDGAGVRVDSDSEDEYGDEGLKHMDTQRLVLLEEEEHETHTNTPHKGADPIGPFLKKRFRKKRGKKEASKGSMYLLRQLYSTLGWGKGMTCALGILFAGCMVYVWQYCLQVWLDSTNNEDTRKEFAIFARFMIIGAMVPGFVFPYLHYVLFLKGSTRIQLRVLEHVFYSPLSFFTQNSPSKIYNCIGQDAQEVEYMLAASLGAA